MSWSGLPVTSADKLNSAAMFNQFLRAIRERRAAAGLSALSYTRIYPRTINPASPPSGTNGQRARAGSQNSIATADSSGVGPPVVYQHNGTSWAVAANQKTSVDRLTTSGTSTEAAVGDYCCVANDGSARGWRFLQNQVESIVTSFADSANNPSGFDGYSGASIPAYTTSTWRAAASINSSGFTRKLWRTIDPASPPAGTIGQRAYGGSQNSDTTGSATGATSIVYEHDGSSWGVASDQVGAVDVLTKYGLAQPGDLAGIWIANEPYTGLNRLRWTLRSVITTVAGRRYLGGSGVGHASVAAAKAAAEAAFADVGSTTGLSASAANKRFTDGTYGATLETFTRQSSFTVPSASFSHEADVYLRVQNASGGTEFDADPVGLSASYENKFGLVETFAAGTATTHTTDLYGSDSPPQWPDEDVTGSPGSEKDAIRGFVATATTAVIRWDVTGGFTYIA